MLIRIANQVILIAGGEITCQDARAHLCTSLREGFTKTAAEDVALNSLQLEEGGPQLATFAAVAIIEVVTSKTCPPPPHIFCLLSREEIFDCHLVCARYFIGTLQFKRVSWFIVDRVCLRKI
jgi:hypothetical protein